MLSTVKKYQLNCFSFKIYSPTLTYHFYSEHSIFSENVSVHPILLPLSNRSPPKLRLINITQYPPEHNITLSSFNHRAMSPPARIRSSAHLKKKDGGDNIPAAQPALNQERAVRKNNHSAKGGDINIPAPPPLARSGIYKNLMEGIIIPRHLVVCWCGLLIREDRFDTLHNNLGRSLWQHPHTPI